MSTPYGEISAHTGKSKHVLMPTEPGQQDDPTAAEVQQNGGSDLLPNKDLFLGSTTQGSSCDATRHTILTERAQRHSSLAAAARFPSHELQIRLPSPLLSMAWLSQQPLP